MWLNGLLVLMLAAAVADASAESASVLGSIDHYNPVAVTDPDTGVKTLVYEVLFIGPSISKRLWSSQSSDGGLTWSPSEPVALGVQGPERIVISYQSGASLLRNLQGGYILFQHYGSGSPSNIWRNPSLDGSSFAEVSIVDLGWAQTGGNQPGSGFPSVVEVGEGMMTMLYQRLVGDGPDPAGLYIARSLNSGVDWLPARIPVAFDAWLGIRAMLAYRAGDGRYLVAYETDPGAVDNHIRVKATDDVTDWSGPAVMEMSGDIQSPSLVVMPDGAFVLFFRRTLNDQSDLFARRSEDGITWAAEIRITDTPDKNDGTPFAVAGASPGVVELYWSQTPDLGVSGSAIVYDPSVVVFDPVYASGFDN